MSQRDDAAAWIRAHCPSRGMGAYTAACDALGCPVLALCKALTCKRQRAAAPRPCRCTRKKT